MRIESQGRVDTGQLYQHVGYVSAAISNNVYGGRPMSQVDTALSKGALSGAILLALLGVMVARRFRSPWRWGMVGVLGMATVGMAVASLRPVEVVRFVGTTPGWAEASTSLLVTMERIERLSALTEDWITRHGHAPSAAQWRRIVPEGEATDGWGDPLHYAARGAVAGADEMGEEASVKEAKRWGYVIYSGGTTKEGRPDFAAITTWSMGPDGVSGTADDTQALGFALKHAEPATAAAATHGRSPRPGKPSEPARAES